MATRAHPQTKVFRGLNNVADPLRLGLEWLTQADNVDVTPRNALVRARGFVQSTSNYAITGAFATEDQQQLYVVDAGELRKMNADLTYTVLDTGLAAAKMNFVEVNGQVFYTNGTDFGVIAGGVAYPWGIPTPAMPNVVRGDGVLPEGVYQVCVTLTNEQGMESGSSDVAVIAVAADSQIAISSIPQTAGFETNVYVTATDGTVFFELARDVGAATSYNCGQDQLGMELPFWGLDAPRGSLPAYFAGQMYVAEPMAYADQTTIWASWPLHYHHFDFAADAIAVPGTVRMLRATESALIIGTERGLHAWDGDKLTDLAPYGVVPGWHASELDGKLYFWSERGLCRALPFENLTENTLSVAPGTSAGAMVLERDGMRRYVVSLHTGGTAFNRRTS